MPKLDGRMQSKIKLPPEPIVVVDIEGNGQVPPDLVEISIQRFSFETKDQEKPFTSLIKPPRPITKRVIDIHGIDNKTVKTSPSWSQIQKDVDTAITGAWFVAHSAISDYEVIKRHLPEWSPIGVIDTLRLARSVFPHLESYSLSALIKETAIMTNEETNYHRAEFDVIATTRLFRFLLVESKVVNWAELCKLAMQPITKLSDSQPQQGQLW